MLRKKHEAKGFTDVKLRIKEQIQIYLTYLNFTVEVTRYLHNTLVNFFKTIYTII